MPVVLLQVLDASEWKGGLGSFQRHEHVEMTQAEKRCSADTAPVVEFFFWLFFSSLRLHVCLVMHTVFNPMQSITCRCRYCCIVYMGYGEKQEVTKRHQTHISVPRGLVVSSH